MKTEPLPPAHDGCPMLIHLVSDQTMQNVLPILALRPRRVVQVMSSRRFLKSAQRESNAVAAAAADNPAMFGSLVEWITPVCLELDAPSISATQSAIAAVLAATPGAVVNYTGGTKNMSIGAYLAAQAAGAPSLYCDWPRAFLSGDTAAITFPRQLADVAGWLTVPILTAAQGLLKDVSWVSSGFSAAEKTMGAIGQRLTIDWADDFVQYRLALERHGLSNVAGGKANAADVDRARQQPVPLPPSDRPSYLAYLAAARDCGLLREDEAGRFWYAVGQYRDAYSAKGRVAAVAMGLGGRAFEAYVAGLLEASRRFTSFASDVKAPQEQAQDQGLGQSDFLAYSYSPPELGLTLISCKSSAPRLEHLESLLARKARFGGLFAKTMVCVAHCPDDRKLRRWCQSLGIECAIGDEILGALGVSSVAVADG